jgi:hypothetical protein
MTQAGRSEQNRAAVRQRWRNDPLKRTDLQLQAIEAQLRAATPGSTAATALINSRLQLEKARAELVAEKRDARRVAKGLPLLSEMPTIPALGGGEQVEMRRIGERLKVAESQWAVDFQAGGWIKDGSGYLDHVARLRIEEAAKPAPPPSAPPVSQPPVLGALAEDETDSAPEQVKIERAIYLAMKARADADAGHVWDDARWAEERKVMRAWCGAGAVLDMRGR